MWRRYSAVILIAALLLGFSILSLVFNRPGGNDPIRDHSITRTNPWGLKALAEVCRQHHLPVLAWDSTLEHLGAKQHVLGIVDPTMTPSEDEMAALIAWVKRGGRLLLAVDLDQEHSILWHDVEMNPDEDMLRALGLQGEPVAGATSTALPMTQAPELSEIRGVFVPGPYRLSVPKRRAAAAITGWQPLLADRSGNVLMKGRLGAGAVYVLSEADILANSYLAHADNVVLAANLLFQGTQDRVYFDERLHLVSAVGSAEVRALPVRRLKLVLWLALAAVAVYLVGLGVRFGSPTPLRERSRRSALEYVAALADLYRRAEARTAIWGLLRQSFRRRLSTLAGTRPDLPAERLAATLAHRRRLDPAQVQDLLAQLEQTPEHPTDEELLRMTRRIAAVEEALTHEH